MNINLTLFGQMIAFVCFVVFCMKYVWPPIIAAMQERAEKIADGLAAADRASHDLELAQEKAVERLKEAKVEASGIIDAANKRASQIVEEAKDIAVVESDRVKVSAQAEIEQEIPFSTNISALNFRSGGLTESVQDILWQTNLPPERLTLEVTESAAVENWDVVRRDVSILRKLGGADCIG